MKIKKVAVLGAGAVGSYVIWGLTEKYTIPKYGTPEKQTLSIY